MNTKINAPIGNSFNLAMLSNFKNFKMFEEIESNVGGSFLEMFTFTWNKLVKEKK